jgi:cytochrome P450
MSPEDPLSAVTHADPYPYYAELVASRPLYRDERLGLWVASSAEAVTAVLTSDLCRVRPPGEPVPRSLVGSPAGKIFGALVRMNDGAGHCPFKQAVLATLGSIDTGHVGRETRRCAERLLVAGWALQDFLFDLSVHVVGTLVGIPEENLERTALWMSDFVRCLAPGSTEEEIQRGKTAAGQLLEMFGALQPKGLLATLSHQAARFGRDDKEIVFANAIGFLSQSYEATAGLIGSSLLARRDVIAVLRDDPPVQNTRRFVAQDGVVAGQAMRRGDAILLVLAAANRDPNARNIFSFGSGVHACPGETIATTIAQVTVEHLQSLAVPLERRAVTYRPSTNTRIPLFPRS